MTAAILSAAYLGLLCSVSPCPLATHIAAVSFIGRQSHSNSATLLAGLCYTAGRMLAFCILGSILAGMLDAVPAISHFLQKYMNMFLGPCMILIAMVLLELLELPRRFSVNMNESFLLKAVKWKGAGAFLLGIIFALSFCPTSAVLYFGTLLPLACKTNHALLLSGIFGLSSSIMVLLFAWLLAAESRKLSAIYQAMNKLEILARQITGIFFLLIGIYFTLRSIL